MYVDSHSGAFLANSLMVFNMRGGFLVILVIFLLKYDKIHTLTIANLPDYCKNDSSIVICENLNFNFVENVEVENDQRGNYRTLILRNATSLRRIPKGIANLSRDVITTLSVTDCKLEVLNDGDLDGFEGLYKLIIRENNLRTMPDYVFRNLSVLQMLDLQSNDIEELSPNTFFGLSSLIYLQLEGNKIKVLPVGVFYPLLLVHEIYLDSNEIIYVPTNTFANNTVLQTLSLRGNQIDFDKNFDFLSYLKTVKRLDLSYNARLRQVFESMFENTRNLEELDISSNNLTYFRKSAFKNLSNLRSLNVSSSKLSEFKIYFLNKCKSLEYLGLAHNNLRLVDFESWQEYTPNLKMVELRGNDNIEVCAEYLGNVDLLKNHGVEVTYENCTEPTTKKIPTNTEDSSSKEICIGVAAGIFGFAIISITLGFLLYRAKHRVSRL